MRSLRGIVGLGVILIALACSSGAPAVLSPDELTPTTTAAATGGALPRATGSATARVSMPSPSPEVVFGAAPAGQTERATVVRVVDGDTIVIDRGKGPEKLRYIGMDTPETVDPNSDIQLMGPESAAANEALVDGREVILERDVSEVDQYGRLLRYVWLDGAATGSGWLMVNLALVAQGYAQVATYPPDVRYVELFLAAQRSAREQGLGLWRPSTNPVGSRGHSDPSAWRTIVGPYPVHRRGLLVGGLSRPPGAVGRPCRRRVLAIFRPAEDIPGVAATPPPRHYDDLPRIPTGLRT